MTKDEALKKIKELEAFIKGIDKPDIKKGQVWSMDCQKYLVVEICDRFTLVSLGGKQNWNNGNGFGTIYNDQFKYHGMIQDLFN